MHTYTVMCGGLLQGVWLHRAAALQVVGYLLAAGVHPDEIKIVDDETGREVIP